MQIYCKEVNTGIQIETWEISQNQATLLTVGSFCAELNKKMYLTLNNEEMEGVLNIYDIIYHMDGENNINNKCQNYSNLPLLEFLNKHPKINNSKMLGFYARINDYNNTLHLQELRETREIISTNQEFEVQNTELNECCVCSTNTNNSCNNYYKCLTHNNNMHYICDNCIGSWGANINNRCPVCRAQSYAELDC